MNFPLRLCFWFCAALLTACGTADRGSVATLELYRENGTAPEISELSQLPFEQAEEGTLFLGISETPVWVRVSYYRDDPPPPGGYLIQLLTANLDTVSFFQTAGDSLFASYHTGEALPFAERPVEAPHFVFPVRDVPHGSEIYLRIASTKPLVLPVTVASRDDTFRSLSRKDMFYAMYTGIVLVMLLYNFFIWFSAKDETYLFYVAAIFFIGSTQLIINGYGNQYFWPGNTWLSSRGVVLSGAMSGLSVIFFARHFLKIRSYVRWVDYVLLAYAGIYFIALILGISGRLSAGFQVINFCGLAAGFLAYAAVYCYRKGYLPALYFLLAWIVFLVAVTVYSLTGFGLLPVNTATTYALPAGSAFEVVLLSFAVASKIKYYREKAFEQLVTINTMKEAANERLEKEVEHRMEEIRAQNRVVEAQKEEILSGIRYAERIQQSLLPGDAAVSRQLGEYFVVLKPRDIVSGDFYWVGASTDEFPWNGGSGQRLFAVADCTGHGVPGALMSVLGYNALDRCAAHPDVDSPAAALRFIHSEIVRALNCENSSAVLHDGMDMVLCAYDPQTRELRFAGARSNLYILRDEEFIVLKGDRTSVGAESQNGCVEFSEQSVRLRAGDVLYLFTDGVPDQFGGAAGKKLKTKPLLKILSGVSPYPMPEQGALISRIMEQWRGGCEQTDDMCLLGIRIS